MALTAETIEHEIRELLGRGRRDLEIEPEGFQAAINRALRTFKRHILGRKLKSAENVLDKGFIDVTEGDASGDPAPLGVLSVKFLREERAATYTDFNVFEYRPYYRQGRYVYHLLRKIDHQNRERVFGTEPDWEYDAANYRLFIYAPSDPVNIGYEVAYPLETVSAVPVSYEQLFMDCVEAIIRVSLGDIRGKHGNVLPGPTGDIQLDGATQREIGERIMERVREDLANIQEPMPPVWG